MYVRNVKGVIIGSLFICFHSQMPPVILKRRHTLKGKNLIPLVRKMKSATGGRIQTLARVKSTLSIEEMTRSEVISAFREITGEDEKEILELAQREVTDANLRHLLHFAIVHANEVGQPAAQNLQPLVSGRIDKRLIVCKHVLL